MAQPICYGMTMGRNHSPEYSAYIRSPAWYAHAKLVRGITKNRCCLIPFLRASECHHMRYGNLTHELPILDTVPLSWLAHKIVHLPPFWFIGTRWIMNTWLRCMTLLVAILVRPILLLMLLGGLVAVYLIWWPAICAWYAQTIAPLASTIHGWFR